MANEIIFTKCKCSRNEIPLPVDIVFAAFNNKFAVIAISSPTHLFYQNACLFAHHVSINVR